MVRVTRCVCCCNEKKAKICETEYNFPHFLKITFYLVIYYVLCPYEPWHICCGQMITLGSLFSHLTMWDLGTGLKSSALVTIAFACWIILLILHKHLTVKYHILRNLQTPSLPSVWKANIWKLLEAPRLRTKWQVATFLHILRGIIWSHFCLLKTSSLPSGFKWKSWSLVWGWGGGGKQGLPKEGFPEGSCLAWLIFGSDASPVHASRDLLEETKKTIVVEIHRKSPFFKKKKAFMGAGYFSSLQGAICLCRWSRFSSMGQGSASLRAGHRSATCCFGDLWQSLPSIWACFLCVIEKSWSTSGSSQQIRAVLYKVPLVKQSRCSVPSICSGPPRPASWWMTGR